MTYPLPVNLQEFFDWEHVDANCPVNTIEYQNSILANGEKISGPTSCASEDYHDHQKDANGHRCIHYDSHVDWCGVYDTEHFKSSDLCCACGGGTYPGRLKTSVTKDA